MIVVADASPINYLLLIDRIGLLPTLYGAIVIPSQVLEELQQTAAPEVVRQWAATLPDWMRVQAPPKIDLPLEMEGLGAGEVSAIQIAAANLQSLLLIDEHAGRSAAVSLGIEVLGTVGILIRASRLGLDDLDKSIARLKQTNFRIGPGLSAVLAPYLSKKDQD